MKEKTITITFSVSDARLIYSELVNRNTFTRHQIFEVFSKHYPADIQSDIQDRAVEAHRLSSYAINSFETAYLLAQVVGGIEFDPDYSLVEHSGELLEKNA